jgi:hypothetical protein
MSEQLDQLKQVELSVAEVQVRFEAIVAGIEGASGTLTLEQWETLEATPVRKPHGTMDQGWSED